MAEPISGARFAFRPLSPRGVAWSLPLLGALPALAQPPLNWTPAAWLALAPALWCLRHGRGGVALWLGAGWGYGLAQAAFQYGWLPDALWRKGGLPFPVFLAFSVAMLAGLALYPALAFALTRWVGLRWGIAPWAAFPAAYAAQDALLGVTPFGGAPWGNLAATQTATGLAGWIVPLAGGSGLALVLAAVGGAWALAFDRARAGLALGEAGKFVAAPLLAAAALTVFCAWPSGSGTVLNDDGGAVPILLVPGDQPLPVLASPSAAPLVLRDFTARTIAAVAARPAPASGSVGPVLAIWPESAVPGDAGRGKILADLFQMSEALDTDVLFGSNAEAVGRIHNSAYLVTGKRFATIRYDKRRLVPFGEYVPAGFGALFGKKLTAGVRDYSAGTAPPVQDWRGVRLGLAICFESILPGHARDAVLAGAEVLIVISNDGWLTEAAARQHLQLSMLRALEVGRDLAFVANGGASAVARDGRLLIEVPRGGAPRAFTLHRRDGLTPWAEWGMAMPLAWIAGWLLVTIGWGPLTRAGARQAWWPRRPW